MLLFLFVQSSSEVHSEKPLGSSEEVSQSLHSFEILVKLRGICHTLYGLSGAVCCGGNSITMGITK